MTDAFWAAVEQQVVELRTATSADDVLSTLAQERNPYGPGTSTADGFFAGEGGDMHAALMDAGWTTVWMNADYYWCARAPDDSQVSYVEGDIYPGNSQTPIGAGS